MFRRPRIDPPATRSTGAFQGTWWIATAVVVAMVAAAITLIVLAGADVLPRFWLYVALVVGGSAAAASRLLTILKAGSEDKKG